MENQMIYFEWTTGNTPQLLELFKEVHNKALHHQIISFGYGPKDGDEKKWFFRAVTKPFKEAEDSIKLMEILEIIKRPLND